MNEFLKMDIFFFVATLSVVLFAFFGAYIFWRFGRILKNIEHISEQVAIESDKVHEDLATLRSDIREGKSKLLSLLGFLGKFPSTKKGKKSK